MATKRTRTPETQAFADAQLEYLSEVFGVEYCRTNRIIPEGAAGKFQVEDEIDIDQQFIYQQLLLGDTPIADNHPDHLDRHKHFLKAARGRVLISGLGLGDSLHQVLQKEEVEIVTVVEKHQEVIDLVTPAFSDELASGRVTFVQGDIFQFYVGEGEYDVIYHAIWNDKKGISASDRTALEKRFADRCDWHGFVFSPGRGGARPGAGRPTGTATGPTKSAKERRDIRKGVRFTDLEYKLITKACEAADVPESTVIQRGAVAEARRILQQSAVLKDPEIKALLKG
jgi:hypothetical protein